MQKLKNLIQYAKMLSKENETWYLAFRLMGEHTLFEGDSDGYIVIPNTIRYWKADPFLFSYKGREYIFCEMYDRLKHKGVIGVARIRKNRCSKFRVCLDLPYHLSFPYVYQQNGEIYMMPECQSSGDVAVFRAVRFPLHWEKAYTVASFPGMDTIPFMKEGKPDFYLSSVGRNDTLVKFRSGSSVYHSAIDRSPAARCAGRIIETTDALIRPSQNDFPTYGNALHFNQIDDVSFECYREHLLLRVLPPESNCGKNEISIRLKKTDGVHYTGVHTYDHDALYEIIDMVCDDRKNLVVFWDKRVKFFNYLKKKIKGNK